jgi:hypothetical protein
MIFNFFFEILLNKYLKKIKKEPFSYIFFIALMKKKILIY